MYTITNFSSYPIEIEKKKMCMQCKWGCYCHHTGILKQRKSAFCWWKVQLLKKNLNEATWGGVLIFGWKMLILSFWVWILGIHLYLHNTHTFVNCTTFSTFRTHCCVCVYHFNIGNILSWVICNSRNSICKIEYNRRIQPIHQYSDIYLEDIYL